MILEWTRRGLARQIADHEAIERKTTQAFALAGVTIGLGGILQVQDVHVAVTLLLAGALLAFTVVASMTVAALWTREYRFTDHTDDLWDYCWQSPPEDVRAYLVADVRDTYLHNRAIGRCKALLLRTALLATSAEILLVGAALIVRSRT